LSIPAVIAASRYGVHIKLDSNLAIKRRVKKSVDVVKEKLTSGKSLYGISTGFGGSGKSLASFLSFLLVGWSLTMVGRCSGRPDERSCGPFEGLAANAAMWSYGR